MRNLAQINVVISDDSKHFVLTDNFICTG